MRGLLLALALCGGTSAAWEKPKGPRWGACGSRRSGRRSLGLRGGDVRAPRLAAAPRTPLVASLTEDARDKSGVDDLFGDFVDRRKRMGFIRKVYSTLSVQMLVTAGVVAYMSLHRREILGAPLFQQHARGLLMGGSILSMMLAMFLSVSEVRFQMPFNYMLLGAFTVLESLVVGSISMFYAPRSVMLVALQTAVAFLGLTIYSFQSNPKYDLTQTGQTLMGLLSTLFIGSLINAFFLRAPWMSYAISFVAVGLFSAFIVHDTHKMIGGRHRNNAIDSKEHIRASMELYLDIINLFIHLLHILGVADGGGGGGGGE